MRAFFLAFFSLLGVYCLHLNQTHAARSAGVKLTPSAQAVTSAENFSVSISIDSAQDPINAAQINLSYPSEKLTFVRANVSGSEFGVQAENKVENGVVKLARGSLKPVTGEEIRFAEVVFSASTQVSASEVILTHGSQVVRSTDNKNILSSTHGSMRRDGMPHKNPYKDPGIRPPSEVTGGVAGFTRGIFQAISLFFAKLF